MTMLQQTAESRDGPVVAEGLLEPGEAAPEYGLIAVDHRLAQRAFDHGHRLDLRRVGAAEKDAVDLRTVVLERELIPALRRDGLERRRARAGQRNVLDHGEAGRGQISDDI